MNSKLLEEAIIDAEALREAALKNAEQAILEKYAPEVKSAIQNLLEQDEPMPAMSMPPLGGDMGPAEKPEMDVPLAATDGEKLCPCPDDDEVVTISISDLEKAISDIARGNSVAQEESPMDMSAPMDMGMEEPVGELPPPEGEEETPLMEDIEISEDLIASILAETEELEEVIGLDEEEIVQEKFDAEMDPEEKGKYKGKTLEDLRTQLKKLKDSGPHKKDSAEYEKMNELEFAIRAKTGWGKVEEEQEDKEDKEEVMQENKSLSSQNSKLLVERKKTLNENKLLTEKLEKLLVEHNKLLEESKKVKATALELSKHLEESNLLNAKLHYKNQALGSDSLNERQKQKIVEAVSKADSVDEAKMIYETLCNAVGSFDSKGPKSLNEAVEKKGGLVIKGRQETSSNTNPVYNKWQKIAGIKK